MIYKDCHNHKEACFGFLYPLITITSPGKDFLEGVCRFFFHPEHGETQKVTGLLFLWLEMFYSSEELSQFKLECTGLEKYNIAWDALIMWAEMQITLTSFGIRVFSLVFMGRVLVTHASWWELKLTGNQILSGCVSSGKLKHWTFISVLINLFLI